MSRRHQHHEAGETSGAGHQAQVAPGKRTLTQNLPARPARDAPARDDDDGAIGPGDLEALPPLKASIIDMAARETGTQLIVSKGRNQGVHLYGKALVVTPEGRKIADATVKEVHGGVTVLMTRAGMDVIDTNEGKVCFQDDSFD